MTKLPNLPFLGYMYPSTFNHFPLINASSFQLSNLSPGLSPVGEESAEVSSSEIWEPLSERVFVTGVAIMPEIILSIKNCPHQCSYQG